MALSLADLPAATIAAFHALGAFAPKPARFDLPAALAVTQADDETLFTLADRNLVEMDKDETLALHQTLADLARTQMSAEVENRHRDHYLAIVDEDRGDWQRIEPIYEQVSFAWAKLDRTAEDCLDFADSVKTYQTRRGLWQDALTWLAQGVNTAQTQGDLRAKARMLSDQGYVYSALGEKAQALAYYEQALPLRRQVGDRWGESITCFNIAMVYEALGDLAKAEQMLLRTVELDEAIGHPDLASDRATLERIRQKRQANDATA